MKQMKTGYNFSYPSSAAAVVFGGHLSARAAFRLDIRQPADAICLHVASYVCVLNQSIKMERMLYKRWETFRDYKTKAEAERTELRNHYN